MDRIYSLTNAEPAGVQERGTLGHQPSERPGMDAPEWGEWEWRAPECDHPPERRSYWSVSTYATDLVPCGSTTSTLTYHLRCECGAWL